MRKIAVQRPFTPGFFSSFLTTLKKTKKRKKVYLIEFGGHRFLFYSLNGVFPGWDFDYCIEW